MVWGSAVSRFVQSCGVPSEEACRVSDGEARERAEGLGNCLFLWSFQALAGADSRARALNKESPTQLIL